MRTTTSRTESTTMRTPMTTLTHRTSTIAWRITTCTEPARIGSSHSHSWLKLSLAPFTPSPFHPCVRWLSLFDSTYSTLYFPAFLLSVFLFPFFHLSDEQQPELNKKFMENLCDSATKGCEDTNDVLYHTKRPQCTSQKWIYS